MLKITATGNLTNDVELKMNETTGKPYAILRIASDRRYEDSRGMFEMMNGHQLMRYLLADQFQAIRWEIVPGTCYERAVLLPIDHTTPAYRAFEQKLYTAILQNYHLNPQKQHDRKEHDTR